MPSFLVPSNQMQRDRAADVPVRPYTHQSPLFIILKMIRISSLLSASIYMAHMLFVEYFATLSVSQAVPDRIVG
jgi:hypothetical protein